MRAPVIELAAIFRQYRRHVREIFALVLLKWRLFFRRVVFSLFKTFFASVLEEFFFFFIRTIDGMDFLHSGVSSNS